MYFTRNLVALQPTLYFGRELAVGDPFQATDPDAEYFLRCKRAREQEAAAPAPAPTAAPAPTPAPTPAPAPAQAAAKPSEGLTVAELKAKLAEKNIPIPDGFTPKADLAALLDGAA